MEEAGKATSYQAVLDALDRWNHRMPSILSVARNRWQWRVSGRRLLTLALALFKDQEEPSDGAPAPVDMSPSVMVPVTLSLAKARGLSVADVVRAPG